MTTIRRWLAALLSLLALPGLAQAGCEGRDLMAALAEEDPEAHTGILERGAAIAHGEGKLWQVSKAGAEPSVILGTYHDTGIAEEPLPAAAVDALDKARAIVVEITPAEQARLHQRVATDPTFAFLPAPAPWVEMLDEEERASADRALQARGLSLPAVARMRPWMLMSMLGVPQCQLGEMAAGKPVLDGMLVARAQENGLEVVGLEDYEAALSAFDLIETEDLREITVDMISQLGGEEDLRQAMTGLYRDGRIGAIFEYSIHSTADLVGEARAREAAEAFRSALITHRNREWMDGLEAELEKGNAFVAFGALHLVGEEGVLALLEQRGWEVERLDG